MQQPMPNLEDITDSTAAMNTTLALMAKAFKLNYSTPTNNNQRILSNPRNRQIAQPGNQVVQNAVQNLGVQNVGNQNGVIVVPSIAHQNGNGNVVAARAEGNANGNNGADIAKITRKRLKTGQEHGNGRAHKKPEVFYKMVKKSAVVNSQSTKVK
ncbi:hypothetical protein Tco_1331841, partial [Tanacetum coccineum]